MPMTDTIEASPAASDSPASPAASHSIRLTQIKLPIDHMPQAIDRAVQDRLGVQADQIVQISIFRRGVDARKRSDVHFIYTLDVLTRDHRAVLAAVKQDAKTVALIASTPDTTYRFVATAPERNFVRPVVIGSGPCGLFAALTLAQMGFRPLILERGKIVRERTKDTWGFWRNSQLKPESNVQFGEGGAGTFSDGKLWSQVKDPHFHGRKVLLEMVKPVLRKKSCMSVSRTSVPFDW
jgi:uncharacterized protein